MELLKRKKNRKIEVIAQLFQNMKEKSDAFMLQSTLNQAGGVNESVVQTENKRFIEGFWTF